MSLMLWKDNGWVRSHTTSKEEVNNLLMIVDRDLEDSVKGISADWRFGIAYNAALKLCTILIYAEGYKPERSLQHYRTIQSLSLILGSEKKDDVNYLDICRAKRNIAEYDYVGGATDDDADELIEFVKELRTEVVAWLKKHYSDLL